MKEISRTLSIVNKTKAGIGMRFEEKSEKNN